jgi:hypothetical protein
MCTIKKYSGVFKNKINYFIIKSVRLIYFYAFYILLKTLNNEYILIQIFIKSLFFFFYYYSRITVDAT